MRRLNHNRIDELAGEFDRLGFLCVDDALSAEQVCRLNEAVDRHLEAWPEDRVELSDSYYEGTNVLPRTADFDEVIENPKTLDILRAILGESITFEEFAVMLRNQTENLSEVKGWHRDLIRDYDRRMEIDAVFIMFYLSDVTENDHCFSIVPETHNHLVDVNPLDVPDEAGIDVIGPTGTAVIFHARAIHGGRLKPGNSQRRTLQAYFSRWSDQRTAEWSEIPPRLHQKQDPTLPSHFYAKWNVARFLEGVGRRPDDLDPDLPLADVIREVQRRAKLQM